jgi:hypothetical protein
MKPIVARHRNSGYTTLITPLAEDSEHWYVLDRGQEHFKRTTLFKDRL